jgi:hypothetical protein
MIGQGNQCPVRTIKRQNAIGIPDIDDGVAVFRNGKVLGIDIQIRREAGKGWDASQCGRLCASLKAQ